MKKSNSFSSENTKSSLPQNKVLKQFGTKAFNRSYSSNDLFSKQSLSTNQKEDLFSIDETSSQKKISSNIPIKRADSAAGLESNFITKKQNIVPPEPTHRTRESVEWEPEMEFEFDAFEDIECNENTLVKESFPIMRRPFFTEDSELDTEEDTLNDFSIGDIEPIKVVENVEYGPKKEIELPYLPDESCIIDRSNLSGDADHVSYQYLTLINKGKLDFDSLGDADIIDLLCKNVFDHKGVEFSYDTADEELETTDCEDFSSGGLDIPFNDHSFDVDSFVQSI